MAGDALPTDQDRRAFETALPDLLKSHQGKFALFHGGAFVDSFDSMDVAYANGLSRFGLELFFIGHVVEKQKPQQLPALMLGVLRGLA